MRYRRQKQSVMSLGFVAVIAFVAGTWGVAQSEQAAPGVTTHDGWTATTFAAKLERPRGLAFGPDGRLYVALAGTSGTRPSDGLACPQGSAHLGPYFGGAGAGIVAIDGSGAVSTVAQGLPSTTSSEGLTSGIADVAFLDGTLYALVEAGGCSHGNPDAPNGVLRIGPDGSTTLVADLSAFWIAHPVAHTDDHDFEPDGDPYSMVAANGALYVVEANHGEVDRVQPDGSIERVVDVSADHGHVVPTAIAFRGAFYLGNLGTFPVRPGSQWIDRFGPSGAMAPYAANLTAILGLAFDKSGHLYALETTRSAGFPTAGTGAIVRIERDRTSTVIATGLTRPTALAFGPDGALYVSDKGYQSGDHAGEIIRLQPPG